MPVTDTHRDPYTIVAEAEENGINWLDRTLGREAIINDTFHYANDRPAIPDINGNVVVKGNMLVKFLPFTFLLFMTPGLYKIWYSPSPNGIFPGWLLFGIMWSIAAVIGTRLYISSYKGYDVILNKEGIEINKRYSPWKEIRATFLLYRQGSGNKRRFLVFVMQDDTLAYFEMTAFPSWSKNFKTLCTAIQDFHRPV